MWWCGANMKPKPTERMQSATASGSRSICAPSASSRSAEPDFPVADRLPCLATVQPAPAATKAAVVDTLKVGRPPPVPAVSSSRSPPPTSTDLASARIVWARPTISATVSPLVRSAIRNAAACASEARPSITSRSTAAASSRASAWPEASRSIAWVSVSLGIQEVAEKRPAVLGEELNALGGQLAVADGHHRLAHPGRALQAIRQVRVHDQRVVAAGDKRRAEPAEDATAVVLHRRALAVDRLAAHEPAAEGGGQSLVAEAHAQRGRSAFGEPP